MLVIRLLRVGKKNQPVFRVVVTNKKNPPKGGRFIEIVGFYNPLTKEKDLKVERIKYWLSVGVQPSDTVHNLLVTDKIIKENKIPLHKKKKEKEGKSTKEPAKETLVKKDEAESPKKEPEKKPEEQPKVEEKKEEEKTAEKPKEEKSKEPEKTKEESKKEEKPEKEIGKKPEEKQEEEPTGEKKEEPKELEKPKEEVKEEKKEEKSEQK